RERRRDTLRAGVRRAALRDARRLHATRHRGAVPVQPLDRGVLPALAAAPPRPRRVGEGVGAGSAVRLRPDPAGVRVRGQLPDPEIPPGAEHRGAERVDVTRGAGVPSGYVLGCGVQGWVGAVGGGAGAEPVVVDHCFGAVCVHRVEPKV
ncbi:protein transparent testa 12, partial [Phtheirospermum japonicum]